MTEFLIIFYAFLGDDGLYYLRKLLVLRLHFFYIITCLLMCEMMEVINGIFWFLSILIFLIQK